ncbi:MAG: MotA/TolQ/ExbB proton channel family protein [Phycisphaerae bacterium]|nr:MotA/TolQ/ExbB proton channel family protein [Phycisphaerae bacterium]
MNAIPSILVEVVLAQTSEGAGAETHGAAAAQIQSVWDFVVKGGPMMIPIGLCSLIALTVIVERLVSLRRRNVIPSDFLPGLKALMKDPDDDYAKALEYCEANVSPLATILAVAIRRLSESIELLEKHIQEAGERVVFNLRKYLRALSVIASICPLMGLLGTIFGMIKAFQTVATSGEALGKTELLAEGIYQAMITTAAGLLVAIPVIIAYHWISARVDRLVDEMDQMTMEFVEVCALTANGRARANLRLQSDNGAEPVESAAAARS